MNNILNLVCQITKRVLSVCSAKKVREKSNDLEAQFDRLFFISIITIYIKNIAYTLKTLITFI